MTAVSTATTLCSSSLSLTSREPLTTSLILVYWPFWPAFLQRRLSKLTAFSNSFEQRAIFLFLGSELTIRPRSPLRLLLHASSCPSSMVWWTVGSKKAARVALVFPWLFLQGALDKLNSIPSTGLAAPEAQAALEEMSLAQSLHTAKLCDQHMVS